MSREIPLAIRLAIQAAPRRFSQTALALRFGVGRASVARWRNRLGVMSQSRAPRRHGRRKLEPENLELILLVRSGFGLSLDRLVDWMKKMKMPDISRPRVAQILAKHQHEMPSFLRARTLRKSWELRLRTVKCSKSNQTFKLLVLQNRTQKKLFYKIYKKVTCRLLENLFRACTCFGSRIMVETASFTKRQRRSLLQKIRYRLVRPGDTVRTTFYVQKQKALTRKDLIHYFKAACGGSIV